MTKKSFKLLFTIIGALLLFSALLCIAVFGVVSLSSGSALAASDSALYYATGTFSQLVPTDIYRRFSYNTTLTTCSVNRDIPDYTVCTFGSSAQSLVLDIAFSPNHSYWLSIDLYHLTNTRDTLTFSCPGLDYSYSVPATNSFFTFGRLITTPSTLPNYQLSISASNTTFGFTNFAIFDLTNLTFLYRSPATAPYIPSSTAGIQYYFGTGFHAYVIDEDISHAFTYTDSLFYDCTYDLAYTAGYGTGETAGYNSGYSEGLTVGYENGYHFGYDAGQDDGYDEGYTEGFLGAINFQGFEYTTSLSDFYRGSATYISRTEGYHTISNYANTHTLTVGFSNFFPNLPYDVLKTLPLTCSFTALGYGTITYEVANSYDPIATNVLFQSSSVTYFTDSASYHEPILAFHFSWDDQGVTSQHYPIYIYMGADWTDIIAPFSPDGINSTTGLVVDLNTDYAFTFRVDNNAIDQYFNAGVEFANSTINPESASYRFVFDNVLESSASYLAGYNTGRYDSDNFTATFSDVISSAVDVPLKTVSSLLNFDFLGINLKAFIYSLLSLGLIIGIIKLIIGARS